MNWDVPEGVDACSRAHRHPLALALFAFLAQARWTSLIGGTILGNDEYHRLSGSVPDYVVESFGTTTDLRGQLMLL